MAHNYEAQFRKKRKKLSFFCQAVLALEFKMRFLMEWHPITGCNNNKKAIKTKAQHDR